MSRFLLALLFVSFSFAPLHAATFRYEFDVVSSELTFLELRGGPFLDAVDPADPLFQEVVSALHVLAPIEEQTGSYVIEAAFADGLSPTSGSAINCVQGAACPFILGTGFVFPDDTGFITGNTGFDWTLAAGDNGSGALSFIDDRFMGSGVVDGVSYLFFGPSAEFAVENLTVTDLSAVPLPASGLLLLFGFAPFLMRRRARNTD